MPKGKRHVPEQIVRILCDAEAAQAAGKNMGQICQEVGISDKTYYRWKSLRGTFIPIGGVNVPPTVYIALTAIQKPCNGRSSRAPSYYPSDVGTAPSV